MVRHCIGSSWTPVCDCQGEVGQGRERLGVWNQQMQTVTYCMDKQQGPIALALLLSRFSRVQLCVTPQTAAHRAPISMGVSRQEHWSGLPFPSPMRSGLPFLQCMKVKSESEVAQSCPTLSDPMDCPPPGSSTHGIFQARVLEWVAIAFSSAQYREQYSISCYKLQLKRIYVYNTNFAVQQKLTQHSKSTIFQQNLNIYVCICTSLMICFNLSIELYT